MCDVYIGIVLKFQQTPMTTNGSLLPVEICDEIMFKNEVGLFLFLIKQKSDVGRVMQ